MDLELKLFITSLCLGFFILGIFVGIIVAQVLKENR